MKKIINKVVSIYNKVRFKILYKKYGETRNYSCKEVSDFLFSLDFNEHKMNILDVEERMLKQEINPKRIDYLHGPLPYCQGKILQVPQRLYKISN